MREPRRLLRVLKSALGELFSVRRLLHGCLRRHPRDTLDGRCGGVSTTSKLFSQGPPLTEVGSFFFIASSCVSKESTRSVFSFQQVCAAASCACACGVSVLTSMVMKATCVGIHVDSSLHCETNLSLKSLTNLFHNCILCSIRFITGYYYSAAQLYLSARCDMVVHLLPGSVDF